MNYGKKVLLACEESQAVTSAMLGVGLDAYSCDIVSCSGDYPDRHLQCDVREVLGLGWDLVIAFPPCTDLACSGARWFKNKRKSGKQQESIDFFMLFTTLPCKWAIENPIGIMSSIYRRPDQIIQPWQYGHGETKATCLWLNDLPELEPTNVVEGREQRIWKMPPSQDRAKLRSKTYTGIAEAMASQWGTILKEEIANELR